MRAASSNPIDADVAWWTLPGGLSALTQDDRKRIKTGFEKFNENRSINGARFFAKFFQNNPAYKEFFPQLRDVPIEEINQQKIVNVFCVHVDRFFFLFDEFMNNMYNSEGLSNSVYGMLHSRSHMNNKISQTHIQNMLDALFQTIAEVLTEQECFKKEDSMAWKKFLAALLHTAKKEID